MGLVAGAVDKYRNIQVFDHLLYFRCVENHSGFNSHIAILIHQHLIIRLAVFSCKLDLTIFHGLFCLFNIPAGSVDSTHLDVIQGIQCTEKRHSGAGCQINLIQWFLQHDDTVIQTFGSLRSLRHQKILSTVMYIDQLIIILIIVDIIALRIVQFQFSLTVQTGNFRSIRSICQIRCFAVRCTLCFFGIICFVCFFCICRIVFLLSLCFGIICLCCLCFFRTCGTALSCTSSATCQHQGRRKENGCHTAACGICFFSHLFSSIIYHYRKTVSLHSKRLTASGNSFFMFFLVTIY